MTLSGFQAVQEELRRLKFVERQSVVNAIAAARALGDLSENAEYHAAKDRQGFIEARISELEDIVSKASVIDVSKIDASSVKFGATVVLMDINTEITSTFQIVGSVEANIKKGLLPVTSPTARAVIGKEVGDVITVDAPGGVKNYRIERVSYV
ncbi:MAG: transcription elongation factor GreA [Holosporales bacterium]|jgi:transcription elongation factor GreA|nr:transcription elongation factor GreA [Holosporales bacterium]